MKRPIGADSHRFEGHSHDETGREVRASDSVGVEFDNERLKLVEEMVRLGEELAHPLCDHRSQRQLLAVISPIRVNGSRQMRTCTPCS